MNGRLQAVEDPTPGDSEPRLTVEQLASETGMSVRNIRNHQSRGLLPPPEVRARIGYYSDEHVDRLRLIQEMQAQGFKLTAIKRLIGEHGPSVDQFVGLKRAVTAPFETESPEFLTVDDLVERFGPASEKDIAKAQKLGLLVPVGDGLFEAPSPALLRAAEEVLARGVRLASALSVIEKVKRSSETTSKAFVALFLDEVWKSFSEAGQPNDRWPEVTETIERLRPLASEVVLAMFKQTMEAEVEKAFGKALAEQAKRGG
ncbi:MAG TPA: MerR family transcriptional regulator [Thermoleophilaceae bacterium]|jgi:DNA-binding transcriptional MerR regulator